MIAIIVLGVDQDARGDVLRVVPNVLVRPQFINDCIDKQINTIQAGDLSSRNGLLQTRLLLESKDIISVTYKIYDIYVDYAKRA